MIKKIQSKYKDIKLNIGIAKKILLFFVIASLVTGSVTGCGKTESKDTGKELSINGFAFNTTYTITIYEGGNQKILDKCISLCSDFEKLFSRTEKDSELYYVNNVESEYQNVILADKKVTSMWKKNQVKYSDADIKNLEEKISEKLENSEDKFSLNQDGSITFQVSDNMAEILEKGIYYSKLSDGKFDITIKPVSELWDFTSGSKVIPSADKINSAKKKINYKNVSIKNHNLTFKKAGMGIDLGGIAKGFIADKLKQYLKDNGVKSAIINLGGNILCIGSKSENKPFNIGVQQPFADRNEVVSVVSAKDISVVSSGIYERYFEENGTLYHHILNPKTGYSYDNGLIAVTILSDKSVDGDGLSTTCFALGLQEGIKFIDSLDNVYALFITSDEKMHYSEGFEDFLVKQ